MELNNVCYSSIVRKRTATYVSESRYIWYVHVHMIRTLKRWPTVTIAICSVYGLGHEASSGNSRWCRVKVDAMRKPKQTCRTLQMMWSTDLNEWLSWAVATDKYWPMTQQAGQESSNFILKCKQTICKLTESQTRKNRRLTISWNDGRLLPRKGSNGVQNRSQISDFLTPVKLERDGRHVCVKFSCQTIGPDQWYNVHRTSIGRLGD